MTHTKKPAPPPMQTIIKGGWRFDVASPRVNSDENPFRRTPDGRRATPLPLPSPMTADTSGERLHPASAETLRQLVKLHGAPAILDAVQKIIDDDAYARLANAYQGKGEDNGR